MRRPVSGLVRYSRTSCRPRQRAAWASKVSAANITFFRRRLPPAMPRIQMALHEGATVNAMIDGQFGAQIHRLHPAHRQTLDVIPTPSIAPDCLG